jgi:hypothetical protein
VVSVAVAQRASRTSQDAPRGRAVVSPLVQPLCWHVRSMRVCKDSPRFGDMRGSPPPVGPGGSKHRSDTVCPKRAHVQLNFPPSAGHVVMLRGPGDESIRSPARRAKRRRGSVGAGRPCGAPWLLSMRLRPGQLSWGHAKEVRSIRYMGLRVGVGRAGSDPWRHAGRQRCRPRAEVSTRSMV